MSTRWYPRFVKGNPQLRIFLPDFWMILKKPQHPLPENQVEFKVPIIMTKYDVRNYLEKIYKIPVVDVFTEAKCGDIKRAPGQIYLIKDQDYRRVVVSLPAGMKFDFPNLFPKEKTDEQTKEMKELEATAEKGKLKDLRKNHQRANVPGWFAI